MVSRLVKEGAERQNSVSFFLRSQSARKAFYKDAGITEECRKNIENTLNLLESGELTGTYKIYASVLRDCGNSRSVPEAQRAHTHISSTGYAQDRFLLNLIVQMYAQCGHIQTARDVFNSIQDQNLYSWNIMFAAYAQNGHLMEAREIFDKMPHKNVVSWNGMITALVQSGRLREARVLFDKMYERDVISWNAMLSGYAQNGHLDEARALFEEMPDRNGISWNAIVSAYAQNGHGKKALSLFRRMDHEGVFPDRVTVAGVISACAWLGALDEGKEIHTAIKDNNGLDTEPIVLTGLINLYGKCGCLEDAQGLFHMMPLKNMVGFTAMITAYGHNGKVNEARHVFNEMPVRVAPTWNAMLSAYAQNRHLTEAMELFKAMDLEGITPNAITIISILDACVNSSALAKGNTVHYSISSTELIEDASVRTALLNMYAKCGSLKAAFSMFKDMPARNLVAWNAIIAGFTQAGYCTEAIELFHVMQLDGELPDVISFLSVLSSCSHAGLVKDGLNYFLSLQRDYGILPDVGLYGCVVDLLARAGWLRLSEELINTMPVKADVVVWISLLGGCKIYGDLRRAIHAARRAHQVDPENPTPYVLLSSMCSIAKCKEDEELAMETMEALKPKNIKFR